MIQLTDQQGLAARKHCALLLRNLGVKDLADYEPHTRQWTDLNAHGRELLKAGRNIITDMAKEGVSDSDSRSLSDASDAITEAIDAIESEKDWRTELGSKEPRQHGGDPRRPGIGEERVALNNRQSPAEAAFALKPEERMTDWLREQRGDTEHASLSLGNYLRAMVLGAKTDAEKRALSEGTDSAGGYTVPDILSARLIDIMRNRAVVFRAGAMTVPLASDQHYIARVASDPVPAWRAEAGQVAESDPTLDRVTLTPRSLAVMCKVSRELFEDSLNLATALPNIIGAAMAVELDRVALFGSGVAPQPLGIANTPGISTVAHNAVLSSYAPLVSARGKLTAANFDGPTAFVMNSEMENVLAGLVDTTGQPHMPPRVIADTPLLHTGNVPVAGDVSPEDGTIIAGDFSRLLVGIRNAVRIEVLRERYADTLQYGILAYRRSDIAVEHAAAFAAITGVRAS
jgi:HK97 family phage major capsid protein